MSIETIPIDLWRADAVVLFHWLSHVDFEAIPIEHRAEKQALTDLFARLEEAISYVSEEEVAEAREQVAKDMRW